jgi:hypothetical protein
MCCWTLVKIRPLQKQVKRWIPLVVFVVVVAFWNVVLVNGDDVWSETTTMSTSVMTERSPPPLPLFDRRRCCCYCCCYCWGSRVVDQRRYNSWIKVTTIAAVVIMSLEQTMASSSSCTEMTVVPLLAMRIVLVAVWSSFQGQRIQSGAPFWRVLTLLLWRGRIGKQKG